MEWLCENGQLYSNVSTYSVGENTKYSLNMYPVLYEMIQVLKKLCNQNLIQMKNWLNFVV